MNKEIFDDIANRYDSWFETPLGRKIYLSEKNCIENLIKKSNQEVAIDLGIGTGLFTKILKEKGYKIVGLDISDQMLKIAKDRGYEVIKHDLNKKLPLSDESFNFAFSMTSIEFLSKPEELIEEVYRILKKDGEFLLITLNSISIWAVVRRVKGLFIKDYIFNKGRFYSPKNLKNLFNDRWKILKLGTCTFIPPWNPLLPSFWEKIFGKIFTFSGAISYILTKKL